MAGEWDSGFDLGFDSADLADFGTGLSGTFGDWGTGTGTNNMTAGGTLGILGNTLNEIIMGIQEGGVPASQTEMAGYGMDAGMGGSGFDGFSGGNKQPISKSGMDAYRRLDQTGSATGGLPSETPAATGETTTDQTATAQAITQNYSNHLSPEELGMFQEMEDNAVNQMMFDVKENSEQLFSSVIADMAYRGVLQGNVGEEAMRKVAADVNKYTAMQDANIRADMNSKILSYMMDKGKMSLDEYKVEISKTLAEQQLAMQKYSIDQGASQYYAGLNQSAESNKWGALGGVVGTAAGLIGSKWLLG